MFTVHSKKEPPKSFVVFAVTAQMYCKKFCILFVIHICT